MIMLYNTSHWESATRYIQALSQTTMDHLVAAAFYIPHFNFGIGSQRAQTLLNGTSKVTREHFRIFIEESSSKTTSSRRTWKTGQKPQIIYEEIFQYLLKRSMINNVADGNQSYEWKSSRVRDSLAMYLYGDILDNLQDFNAPARVYAEDVEQVEIDD